MKKIVSVIMTTVVLMVILCSCKNTVDVLTNQYVDFNKVYTECELDSSYATVASDGSYLKIEAEKPDDDLKYSDSSKYIEKAKILVNALSVYEDINRNLGLPESLDEKIGHTSGLDGKQTEEYDNVKVTWSYNANSGLMILYERK